MLVLHREVGSAPLADEVILTLSDGTRISLRLLEECSRRSCRLGIHAPPSVTVHRAEVQSQIDARRRGKPVAVDADVAAPPTEFDAAGVVAMCRAYFAAGTLPADGEAELRRAVLIQLTHWFDRGRTSEVLAAARRADP